MAANNFNFLNESAVYPRTQSTYITKQVIILFHEQIQTYQVLSRLNWTCNSSSDIFEDLSKRPIFIAD